MLHTLRSRIPTLRSIYNLKSFFSERKLSSIPIEKVYPHINSVNEIQSVLDMSFGDGMNSIELLKNTKAEVYAIDCDPKCSSLMNKLNTEFDGQFEGTISKWSEFPKILAESSDHIPNFDLVLLDVGVSSFQYEDWNRGFNLNVDGPLDLRFCSDGVTASQILKYVDADNLVRILKTYGGVLRAKSVARDILEQKYLLRDINTTADLMDVLENSHRKESFWVSKGEEAMLENINKVVLALRAFVNNEVNEIEYALNITETLLEAGGLLVLGADSQIILEHFSRFLNRNAPTIKSDNQNDIYNAKIQTNWERISSFSDNDSNKFCLIYRKGSQ